MVKLLGNLILACSIVLILTGNAAAEITAMEFLKNYDSKTGELKVTYLQYLNGTGNGLSWANSLVQKTHPKAAIYCPPGKLKVKAKQYITICDSSLPKTRNSGLGP